MGDGKRQESSPTGHIRRGTSWVMVRDKSQVLLVIDGEGHHGMNEAGRLPFVTSHIAFPAFVIEFLVQFLATVVHMFSTH